MNPSYFHNGNDYTSKTVSLHWDNPQVINSFHVDSTVISQEACRMKVICALHYSHEIGSAHYSDAIMTAMASQITSLTIVYSTVYSGADQRKHQNSASLAFVRGIHRRPVNDAEMFPFDDVIMNSLVSLLFPCFPFYRNIRLIWEIFTQLCFVVIS